MSDEPVQEINSFMTEGISPNKTNVDVVQYCRKPQSGNFSVERLHDDIRENLPSNINVSVRVNRYASNGLFKRLADILNSMKYQRDINHITGDVHYLSFLLRPSRTILTILDCVGLESYKGIKYWLYWFIWYWLPSRRCALIVVISKSTKEQVIKYVKCDPNKIRIIHCSVSDKFIRVPKSFNALSPRILHIGTAENKNLERHITALCNIPCTFVIVGELSETQLRALENSHINYENHKNLTAQEVVNEYISCDLLLFASIYEGFGIPIIEAQAIGRPVVTSNLWSMPEVAGDAAILVNPFDIDSIRAGVNLVISNSEFREGLVHKGYQNCKRFSAKNIGEQYAKTYLEVYGNTFK